MRVRLYRRENCSLCTLAQSALSEIGMEVDVEERYLEDDGELEQRYGWRIPVILRVDNQRELDWPFDTHKLRQFLAT